MRMPWFVGAITALMGFGTMALGVFVYTDHTEFESRAITVDAEVLSVEVSVSRSRNSDSGGYTETTSYFPTVAFTDLDGKSRVGKSTTGSGEYNYPVGTTIVIGYDPEDPTDVRVKSKSYPLVALAFFLLLGGVFFIIGCAFFWQSISKRGEPDPFDRHREQIEALMARAEKQQNTKREPPEREPTIRRNR